MRILVMFDLPTGTKSERRAASQFRNNLLKEGFVMMQFSVYYRICNGYDSTQKKLKVIEKQVPHKGSIRAIILTEKQFSDMKLLVGEPLPLEEKVKSENMTVF